MKIFYDNHKPNPFLFGTRVFPVVRDWPSLRCTMRMRHELVPSTCPVSRISRASAGLQLIAQPAP